MAWTVRNCLRKIAQRGIIPRIVVCITAKPSSKGSLLKIHGLRFFCEQNSEYPLADVVSLAPVGPRFFHETRTALDAGTRQSISSFNILIYDVDVSSPTTVHIVSSSRLLLPRNWDFSREMQSYFSPTPCTMLPCNIPSTRNDFPRSTRQTRSVPASWMHFQRSRSRIAGARFRSAYNRKIHVLVPFRSPHSNTFLISTVANQVNAIQLSIMRPSRERIHGNDVIFLALNDPPPFYSLLKGHARMYDIKPG